HEDDALLLQVLADLTVDDLGLVLGGDAGDEALALGLRNADALVRLLDLIGEVLPRRDLTLGRAHEVLDVVEVDPAEVGAPGRHGLAIEQRQALHTGLEHPFGFALEGGDVAHDLLIESAFRARSGGIAIVPAELVHPQTVQLRAVDQHIRHHTLLKWASTVSSAPTHLTSVASSEIGCRWWAPSSALTSRLNCH